MIRLFISYSSIDKDTAEFIHAELEQRGVDAFVDYENLRAGDRFHATLAAEIKSRDLVLFLVSEHSVVSQWVISELQWAWQHKKRIVPVALDGTDLPDDLFFVSLIHRDHFDRSPRALKRLCEALGIDFTIPSAPAQADPPVGAGFKPAPTPPTVITPPTQTDPPVGAHSRAPLQPQTPPETILPAQTDPPVGATRRVAPPSPTPVIPRKPRSINLMPFPFTWIDIPGTLGKKWKGTPYRIAKYPVTNAQYAQFIEAGGYTERQWWTEEGWKAKLKGWDWVNSKWQATHKAWTEPRFWTDPIFNGAEQPVVGVSWYEAVAFCLWLSDATGEKIMLPTDDQWRYAAQGDDGREYPWGKEWDASRCNTFESLIGHTTSVRQYEGKGDSPFGAVDMVGNVWEWYLTDYGTKTNDISSTEEYCVLRGGSWISLQDLAGASYRLIDLPFNRDLNFGFRVVRPS